MTQIPVTARSRIRRLPERGSYDRDAICAVLDEAMYCHVGFVAEDGPVVIPTIHARDGDVLYLHGSPASRMLRTLKQGVDVCVTVTLLDGLVLARSAFHHSMNYRSVVVFGTAAEVSEREEKLVGMRAITERVVPGRWDDARRPDDREVAGTTILRVPLAEASLKQRSGDPVDDETDMDLNVWAGVVPVALRFGEPEPADDLRSGVPLPPYLAKSFRPRPESGKNPSSSARRGQRQ